MELAVRPVPLAGLRSLDEIFWSRHVNLVTALTSARERAASVHQAAVRRCAELAESRLAADALAPRSADAVAMLAADLASRAAALRDAGEKELTRLDSGSLGSARSHSLRTRVCQRLGRHALRTCRDRATAVRLARRLAAECSPALTAATDSFALAAGRSAADLAGQIARWHGDLARFRAANVTLCRDLAQLPDLPPPLSLPAWTPGIETVITAAAGESVRPLTAAGSWWLRLRTMNSVRGDLGVIFGRPGFVADRAAITDRCGRAWRRAVTHWSTGAAAALNSSGCRAFLALLDGLPKAWQRTLDRHEAAARAMLADATAVLDRIDQATSMLSAAHRAWRAIHEDPQGGLSIATRAYLHAIAVTLAPADPTGLLRSDLDDLYQGKPELRIPVVAPMKAGKSTLLSALFGMDIVPRRAQVMTAVPTRFIPVSPANQTEPRLELTDALASSHESLLDAITAEITESQLAALATNPHLQSAAMRLKRGDRFPVAASHSGTREIRSVLAWLHDTARLATIVLPADRTDVIADWRPEVTVPVPGAPPIGRLALIDTPGPGEAAAAPVFEKIMNMQLSDAHGCLIVIDFAQIFGMAEAALAQLIAEHASTYQPSAVAVAVNRIDQRRDGDLDENKVLSAVRQLFDLPDWVDVPVFETAAAAALAAMEYQREPEQAGKIQLLRIAYPVRLPSQPPSDRELEHIAQTVLGDSGVTELRARLLGRVRRSLPALAMRHALARASTLAASGQDAAATTDLIANVNWAAGWHRG